MSHITTLDFSFDDLNCLQQACDELGLTLLREAKEFRMYESDKIPCDMKIVVPGATYEIGLVKKNGKYVANFDPYFTGGLTQKLGTGLNKLTKSYTIKRLAKEAKKKHVKYNVQTMQDRTRITITM